MTTVVTNAPGFPAPFTLEADAAGGVAVGDLLGSFVKTSDFVGNMVPAQIHGWQYAFTATPGGTGPWHFLYKRAKSAEPSSYEVRGDVYTDTRIESVVMSKITGHDAEIPLGAFSGSAVGGPLGGGPSTIVTPDFTVTRDKSLVLFVAEAENINGFAVSWNATPAGLVLDAAGMAASRRWGIAVQEHDRGLVSGEEWTAEAAGSGQTVVRVAAFAINAKGAPVVDFRFDRSNVVDGSLDFEHDNAAGLSTRFAHSQNYAPMPRGAMTDVGDFPPFLNQFTRESRINAVDNVEDLHPMYRGAITADPIETDIVSTSNVSEPFRSLVRTYDRPRRFWKFSVEGFTDVNISPGSTCLLTLPNPPELVNGKILIIRDVRDLPMSGVHELECWG